MPLHGSSHASCPGPCALTLGEASPARVVERVARRTHPCLAARHAIIAEAGQIEVEAASGDEAKGIVSSHVAQRVSPALCIYAREITPWPVAHICRTRAG